MAHTTIDSNIDMVGRHQRDNNKSTKWSDDDFLQFDDGRKSSENIKEHIVETSMNNGINQSSSYNSNHDHNHNNNNNSNSNSNNKNNNVERDSQKNFKDAAVSPVDRPLSASRDRSNGKDVSRRHSDVEEPRTKSSNHKRPRLHETAIKPIENSVLSSSRPPWMTLSFEVGSRSASSSSTTTSMTPSTPPRKNIANNSTHRQDDHHDQYSNHNFFDSREVHPLVALHNEIVAYARLMECQPHELKQRQEMIDQVTMLVRDCFGPSTRTSSATGSDSDNKESYPHVKVFGSQASGLLLPTSDIDLVVLFQPERVKTNTSVTSNVSHSADDNDVSMSTSSADAATHWEQEVSRRSPLHTIADAIRRKWSSEVTYLEVIDNTRVPLVKFTYGPYNLNVDICIDQSVGPKAAELTKTFLQALPPLRPLTFVLKSFLAARALNEPYTGGMGSFALQLLIVSFLQQRERATLRLRAGRYRNDQSSSLRTPHNQSLGCLLLEFLDLYGSTFNYYTTGISVRYDGFLFPKGAKDRRSVFYQSARPSSLALENPLDPQMDVGKPTFRMNIIQRSFAVAYQLLLAQVTYPHEPTESILAKILPPTKEMAERARMMQKPFASSNHVAQRENIAS
jgi:DNA polymerase sigma